MNEVANPLPHHTAVHILAGTERSVLADHAFGDSEVSWFLGTELIAGGYFGSRSQSVWFEEEAVKKMGYSSGTFKGDEAKQLEDLGVIRRYYRNDEQGSGYY